VKPCRSLPILPDIVPTLTASPQGGDYPRRMTLNASSFLWAMRHRQFPSTSLHVDQEYRERRGSEVE